jgi:DNA-binding transcriptional LysR family regulator
MKPFCYHSYDLRQLVSFAEIARTGSFRQAAKTLHIVQPALSRQIKQLEAALGIHLFDRTPRRLHLTIEGKELADRLPALFAQIDYLTEAVKGAGSGGTVHLRIGDAGVLTTEVIAPALRQLRKHWPNFRLSVVQNTAAGFSKSVGLTSHMLCRLGIGLVLPPGHRLAAHREIRLQRLKNERWILPPREANPVLYDELISCCHQAGFTPDVIAEMTQRPRVISQVACGIGIATLVQTMTHLCIGGTTFHRLIRPTPSLDCYLVYRNNPLSPFLKSFISTCLELARDFDQETKLSGTGRPKPIVGSGQS